MVDDVADVHEGFIAGADLKAGMTIRVARGGDDLNGVMEELLAVLHDDELLLEDVEVLADGLHHVGQRLLVALGLGEVGVRSAPEVIFLLEEVDLGVRERGLVAVDESIEVVGVRVAEETGDDLVRRDTGLAESFGQPTEVRVGMTFAETSIDQSHFLADLQPHDVDVKRERIEALAIEDHGILHHRAIRFGPHQVQALTEEHVAIADGEGLDLADLELVDERVGRALNGSRLRGLLRTETDVHCRQTGQSERRGAQEFTTGSRLRNVRVHACVSSAFRPRFQAEPPALPALTSSRPGTP